MKPNTTKSAEQDEPGIFDHPMVPVLIIISWAVGVMTGFLLAYLGGI
jgi:hypothetical protein